MYYFASDVHRGADGSAETRRRERRFVAWLDMAARDAEAIFLVGDIFDFWFEYVRVIPKGFVRTLGKLAEIADSGIRIYFFTGNHDMWCYDYFERECGIKVFFSPQRMRLAGRNVLIAHGDNMNIDDKPLLRLMNTIFRSKTARRIFSWTVHPDLALRFGHWWSGKSRKTHAAETLTRDSLGFLIDYARRYEEEFMGERPILTFPAGLCSRRIGGQVCDLPWKPNFLKKAYASQRQVVPVFVEGELSNFFYRVASLRKALVIKFNIEMLWLPDEMFSQGGKHFRIRFGEPLRMTELQAAGSLREQVEFVRKKTYFLKNSLDAGEKKR